MILLLYIMYYSWLNNYLYKNVKTILRNPPTPKRSWIKKLRSARYVMFNCCDDYRNILNLHILYKSISLVGVLLKTCVYTF